MPCIQIYFIRECGPWRPGIAGRVEWMRAQLGVPARSGVGEEVVGRSGFAVAIARACFAGFADEEGDVVAEEGTDD